MTFIIPATYNGSLSVSHAAAVARGYIEQRNITKIAQPDPLWLAQEKTNEPKIVTSPSQYDQRPKPAPTEPVAHVFSVAGLANVSVTTSNGNRGTSNYDATFQEYFGPNWQTAKAIATAESGLRPNAIHYNSNGSIDRGIMQINSSHCGWVDCSRLNDPVYNISVAAKIYTGSGFYAWTTFTSGAYYHYL